MPSETTGSILSSGSLCMLQKVIKIIGKRGDIIAPEIVWIVMYCKRDSVACAAWRMD